MKYETPEITVIQLDATDIIQTSGNAGGGSTGGGAGGQNETPFNPVSTGLDQTL